MRCALLCIYLLLAGCAEPFEQSGYGFAKIRRDPSDPCRIIITETNASKFKPMAARIEGCKSDA